MPKLHIYKNEKETYHAFADWLAELIKETLLTQSEFTIALPVRGFPKALFKIIAQDYIDKIDWSKVYVFWEDVSFANFENGRNTPVEEPAALLRALPILPDHIYSVNATLSAVDAAADYQKLLQTRFKDKNASFDVVIISVAENDNFLSLISGASDNLYKDDWVTPVYDQDAQSQKIALNIPVINMAAAKAFVVTGKENEDVVQQVLKGKYEPEKYPAQLITNGNNGLHWFLDEGASGKLIRQIS